MHLPFILAEGRNYFSLSVSDLIRGGLRTLLMLHVFTPIFGFLINSPFALTLNVLRKHTQEGNF